MLAFAVKRLLIIIPLLFLISATSFIILQAPPGDYVTQYMARVSMQQGFPVTKEEEAAPATPVRPGPADLHAVSKVDW